MKTLAKTALMFVVSAAAVTAFASDKKAEISLDTTSNPIITISSSGSQYAKRSSVNSGSDFVIDFDPGTHEVSALNFDVTVGNGTLNDKSIKSCESTESHIFMCKVVNSNTLRVLVFSAPAQPLSTTSLIKFSVSGKAKPQLIESTLAVSDMAGNVIKSVDF
ncbi:MAG: hypothetical protein Tsb0027_09160 [Wenzhouxiangellaceae bacterium]